MAKEDVDLKVISPSDCGNAPKKIQIRELNIAFAKNNPDFILNQITDDFLWNIIGENHFEGKEKVVDKLNQLRIHQVLELQIHTIITHGKTASADGMIALANQRKYAFSNVYHFTSAGKNSKVKEMKTYFIELLSND